MHIKRVFFFCEKSPQRLRWFKFRARSHGGGGGGSGGLSPLQKCFSPLQKKKRLP